MTEPLWNVSAGQTSLSSGARREISRPLAAPIYYPEYLAAELETNRLLQKLMSTEEEVLLLTGNATLGIEASLISLLEPGDSMITVNGGVFGQVMTDIVSIVGGVPIEIRVPYGKAVELGQLERALRDHPEAKAVGVVHVETSTGVEFPLTEIARLVNSYGRLLIVDAVSSLGAVELCLDDWKVDVCISSGQKALNAPQGLAIVTLSQRAWQAIEGRSTPIPSVCLDLTIWRYYRREEVVELSEAYQRGRAPQGGPRKVIHGPSPSASLVYALLGALQDLFEEGPQRVFKRHRVASRAVREGVRALNLSVLADEAVASSVVTTVLLPDTVDEFSLRQEIFERYGIALGWGPVELGLHCTRIGTMGQAAQPHVQLAVLEAMGSVLRARGYDCDPDAGCRAAEEVFTAADDGNLWKDGR